jgi:anti-sigma regulatory factor (Ser/Thr protein kinase)
MATEHARAHRRVAADEQAPGTARRLVEEFGAGLPHNFVYELKLLVSELVTNSVEHTSTTRVEVELVEVQSGVRAVVRDAGGGFSRTPRSPAAVSRGWGLTFVDQMADRWGTERTDSGAAVWFELALDAGLTLGRAPADAVSSQSDQVGT